MRPRPELLIFDLDGTLWDAIDSCVEAWNSVLEERGFSDLGRVCREDFLRSMGKNHLQIRETYFSALPLKEREALLQECYRRELFHLRKKPPTLYPGVAEGLTALKEKYRLALVSNCQRSYLDLYFELHGHGPLFDAAICYGDTGAPKGKNISEAMRLLSAHSAVYIGDTKGDQAAAKNAGIPFYFAAYGFGHLEEPALSFPQFSAIAAIFLEA